jgi:hypothetical protein
MGTWGTGNLDNDTARDWLARWSSMGIPAIQGALDAVLEDESDMLPATLGEEGLAALEVLAAICGHPEAGRVAKLRDLTEAQVADARACVEQASFALMRIGGGGSELHVLWDDAGPDEFDAWLAELRGLRARLEAGARDDAPATAAGDAPASPESAAADEAVEIPMHQLVEMLLQEIAQVRADLAELRYDVTQGVKRIRRDVLGRTQ